MVCLSDRSDFKAGRNYCAAHDLIIFLYAGSAPQPTFSFSIPGVSSRHDQSHRE